MVGARRRYRAFISYSQRDKTFARRLHQALEAYRVPRGAEAAAIDSKTRKLGRFFRDDEEMGASTDLGAALRGAIADSESLIVICSPNAARSAWVNNEISHFKATGRADRIFAVIVSGTPNPQPGDEDAQCFPPSLRVQFDETGNQTKQPLEPLAVDVRKESFNRIVTRLAAGLAQTSFDGLWKREQRRSFARWVSLSGFALAATAFIVGALTQNIWQPRLNAYLRYERYTHSDAALANAQPSMIFQDCIEASGDCPRMIILSGGEFVMGSSPSTPDSQYNERPQRAITLFRFAVSQTEITFGQWNQCVLSGGCNAYTPAADGFDRPGEGLFDTIGRWSGHEPPAIDSGDLPVFNISWDDAQSYVAWLSEVTGARYRLLTEAEWEYAARAGATNAYAWGDEAPVCDATARNGANFLGCEEDRPRPVKSYVANAFGLYDMSGNVAEWVQDCFAHGYDPTRTDGRALEGAEVICDFRTARGGAWSGSDDTVRNAYRIGYARAMRRNDLGFRVARDISRD